jgi:arylformamidase
MCDAPTETGLGWNGWMDIKPSNAGETVGVWVDLSHPLGPDMPRVSFFPQPRFEQIMKMPEHPLNVTEIQMVVHIGTHLDSPRHFFSDGPAFEDIPLERLYGPGIVWTVDVEPDSLIEPNYFNGLEKILNPGDILALNTGWSEHVHTPLYERHPALSVEAARWIVAHQVKMLAVDMPTPDLPVSRRPDGFDWPVHHCLLADGVLVAEHLRNLDALAGQQVEFMVNALNIENADGAPVRILARNMLR